MFCTWAESLFVAKCSGCRYNDIYTNTTQRHTESVRPGKKEREKIERMRIGRKKSDTKFRWNGCLACAVSCCSSETIVLELVFIKCHTIHRLNIISNCTIQRHLINIFGRFYSIRVYSSRASTLRSAIYTLGYSWFCVNSTRFMNMKWSNIMSLMEIGWAFVVSGSEHTVNENTELLMWFAFNFFHYANEYSVHVGSEAEYDEKKQLLNDRL